MLYNAYFTLRFRRFTNYISDPEQRIKPSVGYKRPRQVFSDAAESELEKYILAASKLYYGLSTKDVRSLACQYAVKNNVTIPAMWFNKQHASCDWLSPFLKRKIALSILNPWAISLGRATSFNKHSVEMFFANLSKVYDKYKFQCQDIYNVDETATTTIQRMTRILGRKGVKQVGAVMSSERGSLVTVAVTASARGNYIPPFFAFPRKNFGDYFIANGPKGSAGSADKSRWMTGDDFLLLMEHSMKHTRVTKYKPVLLLLDNHHSHLSLRALDLDKDNGVVLLSFPPQTATLRVHSHRISPVKSRQGQSSQVISAIRFHTEYIFIILSPGKTDVEVIAFIILRRLQRRRESEYSVTLTSV
jgi:hypothetical protein